MTRRTSGGQIRIIGGEWRGRRIPVHATAGLRPTPDRVRETLFNWLSPYIPGSRCLDLFAGSGALALEAASRGAEAVVAVDQQRLAADALRTAVNRLNGQNILVVQAEALQWLERSRQTFDIVFLDPPFGSGLLAVAARVLLASGALRPGGVVYFEAGTNDPFPTDEWDILRSAHAGQVHYRLATRI